MQKRNRVFRVVIDTNVWINFLISNHHKGLDEAFTSLSLRILFSKELLSEISKTIEKPKLKRYFLPHALEEMLLTFEPLIDLVDVSSKVNRCRDPKDNFLLSLAKDGKADFLISGDQDLLVLTKFGKTRIVTIREFIRTFKIATEK